MAMIRYVLIPNISSMIGNKIPTKEDKDKIYKQFLKYSKYIEKLNIEKEIIKAFYTCFKFDTYYGYQIEDDKSFYLKDLDGDYCKIINRVDGNFNFAFDFSYFDLYDRSKFLPLYPNEFKVKYELYKKQKASKWQELNPEKTVCFKFYEDMPDITFPPYCNLFGDLYDINDYKQIDKQKAENENFHLIGMQVETNGNKTGKPNSFSVDLDLASEYYEIIQDNMPEGVGVFLSPVKWEAVDFNTKNDNAFDRVQNSTRNFWDGAGVSAVLFNSGSNSAGTLRYSMLVDTNMLYGLYRQAERWINTKLYSMFKDKVKIKIFDINRFNEQEVIDNFLKMGQYGMPVKTSLGGILGYAPMDFVNLVSFENDILELQDRLIPLMSSYTQTNDNEVGAPSKKDEELTEAGTQTRESGANENR